MTSDGPDRFEVVRAGHFLCSIQTNYEFARRMFPTATFTKSMQTPNLWLVQLYFDDEASLSLQAQEVT